MYVRVCYGSDKYRKFNDDSCDVTAVWIKYHKTSVVANSGKRTRGRLKQEIPDTIQEI